VEVVSAEQARTLTYAVESWAGRLDEDMGSLLHRDSTQMWLRDPVQGPVRVHYAAYQHRNLHGPVVLRPGTTHRQRTGRPVAGQGAEQGVVISANTWAKHRGE
jgi:hypothetical protein